MLSATSFDDTEDWMAVPRPDTHRTLISLGAVGSLGEGGVAERVRFELCACIFQTYACSAIRDGIGHC